jgi:hypothetical protein
VRGRLRRALAQATGVITAPVEAVAVFTTYDPRRVAGAFAAGMGFGSIGGGAPAATVALGRMADWGEREARQFEALPHKVLVATTADAVHLFEWPVSAHAQQVACWERGSFQARLIRHRLEGQVDVFIALATHKNVVLSAKAGLFRRASLRCAQQITRLSAAA